MFPTNRNVIKTSQFLYILLPTQNSLEEKSGSEAKGIITKLILGEVIEHTFYVEMKNGKNFLGDS